jgi:hypothetical protein
MHQKQRTPTTSEDRRALSARAREAQWQKLLREIDPNEELDLTERITHALKARHKYFVELGKRGRGIPKTQRRCPCCAAGHVMEVAT